MGMCSACAITSPCSVKSAVEQSWRSLMFDEYEALISASPISSAIDSSALPMTSSVIRSSGSFIAVPRWRSS
jgi:hypothetical protein